MKLIDALGKQGEKSRDYMTTTKGIGDSLEEEIDSIKLTSEPKHEKTNEPPRGKTNNLHMRKQRRRSASR